MGLLYAFLLSLLNMSDLTPNIFRVFICMIYNFVYIVCIFSV